MSTLYLDSGALDPNVNPIYASETTPTTGVSAVTTTPQPSVGSITVDTPQNTCDQKWAIYSAGMTFPTQEAYMLAYNAYLAKCLNTGVNPVTASPVGVSTVSPVLDEEIKPVPTATTTPTTGSATTPTTPTTGSATTPTTTITNLIGGLGGFGGGFGGGGGGGATTEEGALGKNKKPFPYWLIAVAVVGGYLIFRKK